MHLFTSLVELSAPLQILLDLLYQSGWDTDGLFEQRANDAMADANCSALNRSSSGIKLLSATASLQSDPRKSTHPYRENYYRENSVGLQSHDGLSTGALGFSKVFPKRLPINMAH